MLRHRYNRRSYAVKKHVHVKDGIPFQPHKQHASNTNLRIVCTYCNKPRLVYSKNKVSDHYTNKFRKNLSDLQFVCGTTVSELVGPDQFKDLYIRANLQCRDPVETIYFNVGYIPCCTHCGSKRNLNIGNNEYPMCAVCKASKKIPLVR